MCLLNIDDGISNGRMECGWMNKYIKAILGNEKKQIFVCQIINRLATIIKS